MISIVDYGLGNVGAFLNMYKRMNIAAKAVRSPAELDDAKRIILPGVGAFDHAMDLLEASGMRPRLTELVVEQKTPIMGVCVGMQILANRSEEGTRPGLGWIPGTVRHLARLPLDQGAALPHMGWNDVSVLGDGCSLMSQLENRALFYFLHSYYFECEENADCLATAIYGGEFACVVGRDNVLGVQFHPEKSHHFGAQLLQNFAEF